MGNLTTAFMFVWFLNILMFTFSLAVADLQPANSEQQTFYNCSGSIFESISANSNCQLITTSIDESEFTNSLPTSSITPTEGGTGFVIVDFITTIVNIIKDNKFIKMFTNLISAPSNILKAIPIFQGSLAPLASIIGLFWWGISLFLLWGFIFGRDT